MEFELSSDGQIPGGGPAGGGSGFASVGGGPEGGGRGVAASPGKACN